MPSVEHHHGAYIVRGRDWGGKEGTLVQSDWDYPSTAQSLGWNMRRVQPDTAIRGRGRTLQRAPKRGTGCDHSGTDGTVDCPDCGVRAGEFIAAAGEYLDSIAS